MLRTSEVERKWSSTEQEPCNRAVAYVASVPAPCPLRVQAKLALLHSLTSHP